MYVKPKVFISVGSASNDRQARGAESIFRCLELAGLSPRQMGKNEWSFEQPLQAIRRVMEDCDGAVVIAFTRHEFSKGHERKKDGTVEELSETRRLPTVWNHIEAAMAYSRRLPLLVVVERNLSREGILEDRYDWQVHPTDFSDEDLQSEAFSKILASWKEQVVARSLSDKSTHEDLANVPIAQLLGRLTVPQTWKLISAVLASFVGVATIAFRVGAGQWPWQ